MLTDYEKRFIKIVETVKRMIQLVVVSLVFAVGLLYFALTATHDSTSRILNFFSKNNNVPAQLTDAELLAYGKELVAHTAAYLGPNGNVAQISNGMNCQNCHLDAGTKDFGNNFRAVATSYPKVRGRSGKLESVEMRINDCFKRSLNGDSLDWERTEMKAMVAYINAVGTLPKEVNAGIFSVALLPRAADPAKGEEAYTKHCVVCHGDNGQGLKMDGSAEYVNPPLWGMHSYNTAAGLYRLSRFAGYIKTNMPFGATAENPILTDEEAWDIAAYVNSQERPIKTFNQDWPDISKKPMDHPFGPFADNFSEQQHKYGPFQVMQQKQTR